MNDRINFLSTTRDIIAARAGYRCSLPECGKLTIGPDLAPDKFVETGKASHIFSASPGGPRGQGGLSDELLASPSNGIWLCDVHARMVDANRGASYPPALLQSYKALQEAKAARESLGLHYPVRWFDELTIRQSPIFEDGTKLRFGKLTLIIGPNRSGKSALGDWLSGFGDHSQLWRWMPKFGSDRDLDLEIELQQPEHQKIRLQVRPSGVIEFELNGHGYPVQPLPMRFVFLREERTSKSRAEMDDLEQICDRLNIDPLTLPGLLPYINDDGLGFAKNMEIFEDTDDDSAKKPNLRRSIRADVVGTSPGLAFQGLSHGEQVLVLLELAVAAARSYSQCVPTMLILDRGMERFSAIFMAHLSENLSAARRSFQTVIVVPEEPLGMAALNWTGWTLVRLLRGEGATGKTTVAQVPF